MIRLAFVARSTVNIGCVDLRRLLAQIVGQVKE
jgi:hypothetical protein